MSLLNVLGAGESVTRDFNGLKIDAPKMWEDRSTVVLRSIDRQGEFRVNLVITRAKAKQALDALVEELRDGLQEKPLPAMQMGETQALSVDGQPALAIDLHHEVPLGEADDAPRIPLVRRHVMVIKGETLFNLIFTDVEEFFDAHRSNIEAMIKSVKLPA